MNLTETQLASAPLCANCSTYLDEVDAKIVQQGEGWVHVESDSVRCPGQGDDGSHDVATPLVVGGVRVTSRACEPETITIELDPESKAFYAGVAAGMQASDLLAALTSDADFQQRLSYFWLSVGTTMAESIPGAGPDLQTHFVRGAGMRQPEQSNAVIVTIPNLDDDAFGIVTPGESDQARAEIARLLRDAALRIVVDEEDSGDLHDPNGNTVGSFTVSFES